MGKDSGRSAREHGARAEGNAMAAANLAGTDEERAEQALIAAAGKISERRQSRGPGGFHRRAVRLRGPGRPMRYDARQLAGLAADAWSLLAGPKTGSAENPLRDGGAGGRRCSPADRVGARDRQRRHAVPGRFRARRAGRTRRRCPLRRAPRVHGRARRGRAADGIQGHAAARRRAARKRHPHPCRADRRGAPDAPRSSRRSSRCSPTSGPASRIGAR